MGRLGIEPEESLGVAVLERRDMIGKRMFFDEGGVCSMWREDKGSE